jgi:hypothetical protein
MCRREDNIEKDLGEIACEGVGWIHLAQDNTLAGFCEQDNEPLDSINGL